MEKTDCLEVVDRGMFCKSVARKLGMTISDFSTILDMIQREIQEDVRDGKRIQMNGFLIITPRNSEGMTLKSPLNGLTYEVPPRRTVEVRVGKDFKQFIRDGYTGNGAEKTEEEADDKPAHRRRTKES